MTMLEKAARALHADWLENYNHAGMIPDPRPFDKLDEYAKTYATNQARAVLMAIREPDDAAEESAYRLTGMGFVGVQSDVSEAFTAMIDHILGEEK